jgi:hypothetical protein
MDIHVFLLCYNESALLPHTIHHYKKYLPSCKITVYDNESTDASVQIAKELGCSVVSWSSNNILNEDIQIRLRNTIWKSIANGWILMADMDEFVCVSEDELLKEKESGTSVLQIKGYDMIGESQTVDLTDIDLQKIEKCIDNHYEDKNLCFLREKITDMDYGPGSHSCNPKGNVVFSSTLYKIKHMNALGLEYLTNKLIKRYERAWQMRNKGWSTHYTNDIATIKARYTNYLNTCKLYS